MKEARFNIRVYGILINENNEVLLSDEDRFGKQFTKFPGGGLHWGEGTRGCLIREFQEELGITIDVDEVFYVTDIFQKSAFNDRDQLISIYYLVNFERWKQIKVTDKVFDFKGEEEVNRWLSLSDIKDSDLTFPIDKIVARLLIKKV